MQPSRLALAFALAVGLCLPALADDATAPAHAGHAMAGMAGPATAAYEAANLQMHTDMAIDYTGDADVDFIKGMIPHHQGAVAMARIVLEHGSDPEVKALAENVIKAQEAEIAWMQDWLAKHGQ
ncbi:MAG: DUF305 domain-containing protein [Alphaproteobacteria bacterium]|nr:DUF305 domain-containing protein [Alphaproteobacteria bacterium]